MLDALEYLQSVLGKQNNFVGFDPRAVNNSGPDISCFPGKHHTQALYDPNLYDATDVNSSVALANTWGRAGAFGEWCSRVHAGSNSSAKYVNTVAVSNDMLRYTELLAKSKGQDPKKSELWYYGVSYGTVLGSTFAALFPDRVGRLVLDGVVDGEDYYQGKWEANLPDADAAIETFFKYCYEAGSDQCEFWDRSPEAIKARFNRVMDMFKARPFTVTDRNYGQFPAIVTYTDWKSTFIRAPYQPMASYPSVATMLKQLEAGNANLLGAYSMKTFYKDQCSSAGKRLGDIEPMAFISCNDANGRYNLTDYDLWLSHAHKLYDQSHYLGEAWAPVPALICRSLRIRVPDSQVFRGPPSANKTKHPILFMSNTIDPVTPLRAAQKMSKLFGGSRLLVQDSVGHSTFAAASKCTWQYATKYMQDASLPPEGTVCKADEVPFKSGNMTSTLNVKFRKRSLW